MDPSTIRFGFTLQNLDATNNHQLRTLSGPWSFFRRMRITCGGQVVEDIDNYARTHEMFEVLSSQARQQDDKNQGFGVQYDILRNRDAGFEKPRLGSFQVDIGNPLYPNTIIKPYRGIPPGDSKTVYFKPLAGIFNQHKFKPLRYCPIQIEFEVVNSMNDPIIYSTNPNGAVGCFLPNALSNQWLISNIQFKCDLVTLDNGLENEYAAHLLSGKSLPISYDTYITQYQTVASADYAVNIARAFTRLKSVFVTFYGLG